MEIKVGGYVRTKLGIAKLIETRLERKEKEYYFDKPVSTYESHFEFDYINELFEEDLENIIEKSSPNIIDLIEVGDYVNGHKVIYTIGDINKKIYVEYVNMSELLEIKLEQIASIVTKEQFKEMEYRL